MKKVSLCNDHCNSSLCSREIIYFFLVGQVSGRLKNFSIGIFADTIDVINVKLHDGTTRLALPVHFTFNDLDFISRSQQCQTVLAESFIFLSS